MLLGLVNARILHESFLVPVMYGSKTMTCNKKERSRIRAVQMDNFRCLPSVRIMDSLKCKDKAVVRSDEGCG